MHAVKNAYRKRAVWQESNSVHFVLTKKNLQVY
jgi:hypothetical protein